MKKTIIAVAVITAAASGLSLSCKSLMDRILPGYNDPLAIKDPVLKTLSAKPQQFRINPGKANIIAGTKGNRIFIPANAFVDISGKTVSGTVDISLVELSTSAEIAGSEIPMDYSGAEGSGIFVSKGMFRISASSQKKSVGIRDGVSAVGLFNGAETDGETSSPGYENYTLNQRGKWEKSPASRTKPAQMTLNCGIAVTQDAKGKTGRFHSQSFPDSRQMYVSGTMNGWKMPGTPMTKNSDGQWEFSTALQKEFKFKLSCAEMEEIFFYLPEYHFKYIPSEEGMGSFTSKNFKMTFNATIDIRTYIYEKTFVYPLVNCDAIVGAGIIIRGKLIYEGGASGSKINVRNIFLDRVSSLKGTASAGSFEVKTNAGAKSKILVTDEQGFAGITDEIKKDTDGETITADIVMKKVPKQYIVSSDKLSEYLGLPVQMKQ